MKKRRRGLLLKVIASGIRAFAPIVITATVIIVIMYKAPVVGCVIGALMLMRILLKIICKLAMLAITAIAVLLVISLLII